MAGVRSQRYVDCGQKRNVGSQDQLASHRSTERQDSLGANAYTGALAEMGFPERVDHVLEPSNGIRYIQTSRTSIGEQ